MALRNNTWKLNQWYDQDVAGNVEYSGEKQLWVWGQNERGQLGQNSQGNPSNVSSPVQIPGSWSFVTPKLTHAFDRLGILGVKTDGTLWGWGGNGAGMLGLNSQSSSPDEQGFVSSPTQIPGTTWTWGATGYRVSMFNKTDGTTWIWGNGGDGMLGLNATVSYSSPVQLTGSWANGRDKFGSGHNVMLAINGSGELMAWGENTYGNLGASLGHGTKRSSPIQIASGTWSTVCDGGYEEMGAVNDNGELWTWGRNQYGGLGQDNTTDYSSPKQVGSDTTWHKCSLTENGILASKTDGTLWSSGRNEFGELGHNNTTSYSSPRQVGSDTTWDINNFQIGMAVRAMKTDGTLWAWGRQDYGQFGDNSTTSRSSPVQIPGTDWHMVDAMYRTTFAIKQL